MAAIFSLRAAIKLILLTFAILVWAAAVPAITADNEPAESKNEIYLFGSYLSGRIARGDHDTSTAARFYAQALAKDPDSDILLESSYMLETIDGNWERAFQLAESLIKQDGSHRIGRYVLGAKALKEANYALALKHFSAAKNGPISDLTTQLAQAWIELGQGKSADALRTLDAMKDADWSRLYKRYHRALIADLAGRTDIAREAYASAFKKNERTLRIAEAYARFAASGSDYKKAKEVLSAHLGEGPGHPLTAALLKDVEKGQKVERLVKSPQEGVAEVLYGIGDVLTSEGGIELGTIYLQLALYLRPEFPLARVALGEVYEASRKHDLAIQIYDAIGSDSPLWLNVQIRKALSQNALEQVDEAKALLEQLAADYPAETRPLDALGNIMRSRERYEEAQAAYSRAVRLVSAPKKEHWALFYSRGVSYERLNQWPKAEADLKLALKLNPDQPLILNYLGYSWVDKGSNLKQAMALIRKAVKLKPDDGYFVDSLGWAYYRLGNHVAAVEQLERAVELRPEDPVINDHLGDAYWFVGRKVEAKFQWSQALTLEPEPDDAAVIRKKLAEGIAGDRQLNAQIRSKKTEN